jgi:hypothetical protein
MSRLTKEEVQFIDNYLYNAGVHYIDIRCEMTDHVATAIESMEGDFGYNFSRYMANHKRELMASNRDFKKKALLNAGKMFFGNYKKPLFLLGTIAFIALVFLMANVVGYNQVSDIFLIGSLIIHLAFYFCWVYFWIFRKNRYSVIDRLLIVSLFLPAFFRFEKSIDNENIMLLLSSVYMSLEFTLIYTVFEFQKKYKQQYHG